jgi:hypothetical protein
LVYSKYTVPSINKICIQYSSTAVPLASIFYLIFIIIPEKARIIIPSTV